MNLSGQVVLVTGAGQGIGKACALAMAKAGADVATVDINGESVKETAAAIAGLGRRSLALQADLGSVAEIDRMIGEAITALGRIDTLVNNAGVTRRRCSGRRPGRRLLRRIPPPRPCARRCSAHAI